MSSNKPLDYSFPDTPKSFMYSKDIDRCYRLIQNQAHYLVTLVHGWNGDDDFKLLTASKGVEEHIVRPNTGALAIFSFLYRYGNYDENSVGVSRENLLNMYIIPMFRYLVSVHKTGYNKFDNGKCWGGSWQSALWTHQLSQAAITVWNDLPSDIQKSIFDLVFYEAEVVANKNPPYEMFFDSKSEENAWNAGALSAAIMLMPEHKNKDKWEKALQRWLLSSYLCPNDAKNDIMIDGKPLYAQFQGANIFNDYTLENHGIVHPDYMTACTLKGEIMIDYIATKRNILDACMYNVDKIYEQLKILLLPSGGFIYPTGQDWAIFRHSDWANIHAFCLFYYKDPVALYWLRITLDVIERMQNRHPDGRIYAPNENFFPSSQTLSGLGLVDVWKMLMMSDCVVEDKPDENVTRIFNDGKFFINKMNNSIHTISWGKRIQFQCMNMSNDPIMAPDWSNGVGFIRLKGENSNLDIMLKSLRIDTLTNGYEFNITLNHGDVASSKLLITSFYDGRLSFEEELVALKDFTSAQISTMNFGILNHYAWIEEKGYRVIYTNHGNYKFTSMSGKQVKLSGNRFVIDDRMFIECDRFINGIYICADKWNRSKLVDKMILNYIDKETVWMKGNVINKNKVVISYKNE